MKSEHCSLQEQLENMLDSNLGPPGGPFLLQYFRQSQNNVDIWRKGKSVRLGQISSNFQCSQKQSYELLKMFPKANINFRENFCKNTKKEHFLSLIMNAVQCPRSTGKGLAARQPVSFKYNGPLEENQSRWEGGGVSIMDDSMIPLLGDTWQGSLCVISEPNSGNSEFFLRFTFVSLYASIYN